VSLYPTTVALLRLLLPHPAGNKLNKSEFFSFLNHIFPALKALQGLPFFINV